MKNDFCINKRSNVCRLNYNEMIFTISYGCLLISFMLSISTLPNEFGQLYSIMRYLKIIGYATAILKILHQKFIKKQVILIVIIGVVFLVTSIQSNETTFVSAFLLISASRGIDFRKIVKTDLFIRIMLTCLFIILSTNGIIENRLEYRSGILTRASLGFSHPNRFALNIFIICLYWTYLRHNMFKLRDFIGIISLLVFMEIIAGGRSSMISIISLLIFEVSNTLIKDKKLKSAIRKYFIKVSYFAATLFFLLSYLLSYLYNSSSMFLETLNQLFNTRIYLAHIAIMQYGIKFSGQTIEYISLITSRQTGVESNGIDNMYIYLGITFGIIVLVIYYCSIILIIREAKKRNEYIIIICLFIVFICGIMENQFLAIESNIFLLYLGKVMFKNNFHIGENVHE